MTRILTIAWIVWLKMLRKKDIYVLLILLGAFLIIIISLNVFGLGGMVNYVKDAGLLMAWIFGWMMAVNVSSREIPEEEARGTIFPLLAKPLTRFEFLFGKLLGSWSIVISATLLFYIMVMGIVLMRGGACDLITTLQGYVLHCMALAVICAISMAFSTRMNQDAAASMTYVFTVTAFFLVRRIPVLMFYTEGLRANIMMIIYNLMPHLELFDMRKRIIHDYGPLDFKTFAAVLTYGALLSFLFLILSFLAYRKKHFSRGNMLG